jgi:hypothetical protein
MIWSPGFSRIGRSVQHAAAPAGIHRLKPGLQYVTKLDWFINVH